MLTRRLTFALVFTAALPAPAAVDFAHDVAPVLKQYCGDCHLGEKKKGGLSMNTRTDLLAGSENGKIAGPGKPDEALLLKVLTTPDKDEQMPPKGDRVPPEKVAVLRAWIAEGMPWEDGFTFGKSSYEPPLQPRKVTLPPVQDGREHPIDRIVDHYYTTHQVKRPAAVSDAGFIRRAGMDITGLLPEPEEVEAFVQSADPHKRAHLVTALLGRDVDYAEHWLTFWNDLLRNDYQGTGYIDGGRKPVTAWLYRALVQNMPYDRFARELLAPAGADSEGFIYGIKWRGNVNASQVREVQFSQSISQVFLGINMKCASCHDSFVDRWKLDEAYALAAVYSDHPLEVFRCDKPTGRTAKAGWIFPELGNIDAAAPQPERLKQLAALMTHPENGRFTRTIVNRIWHRLMGRGIVHPVDAMHTEPWSTDLLDYLAVWFAEEKYDIKKLIAFICRSQAWQAQTATAPADGEAYVFRGPLARRLTAEQFVDAVWRLTGTAPAAAHGSVPRGKPAQPGEAAALTGQWIWSYASASAATPAGEAVTFRREFTLPAASPGGVAVASCDNACEVLLNGKPLARSDNWEAPATFSLPKLKPGRHIFTIRASNGGSGPNPAGLYFEARLRQPKGADIPVATDAAWQWAPEDKPGAAWKQAAATASQSVWAKVNAAMAGGLAPGAGSRPVRASIVPSDLLQRTLGRPNREQIVSMRPENLTTLEAIDLANGAILAGLLKQGAASLAAQWQDTPQALAETLTRRALTRPPTGEEAAILTAALGAPLSPQSIEDALWMLLMLPEFQFVR